MSKRKPQPKNEFERKFITAIACAISNALPSTPDDVKANREKEFAECINRLGGTDVPAEIFSLIINALDANPWQNFLGDIFTMLGLFDYWKGQLFTP